MEQVFFNVPLFKLKPVFKGWMKEVLTEVEEDQITPTEGCDQFLSVQEAAKFLRLKVPTIYRKVSLGELPVMKRSNRLFFSRSELMKYLKEGRKTTNAEIQDEVDKYISQKVKG